MDSAQSRPRNDASAPGTPVRDPARMRAANIRTALVFASIALTFFVGVIASKFMGGYRVGMSIVGVAVLVFLAFAIGRNLRKGR